MDEESEGWGFELRFYANYEWDIGDQKEYLEYETLRDLYHNPNIPIRNYFYECFYILS